MNYRNWFDSWPGLQRQRWCDFQLRTQVYHSSTDKRSHNRTRTSAECTSVVSEHLQDPSARVFNRFKSQTTQSWKNTRSKRLRCSCFQNEDVDSKSSVHASMEISGSNLIQVARTSSIRREKSPAIQSVSSLHDAQETLWVDSRCHFAAWQLLRWWFEHSEIGIKKLIAKLKFNQNFILLYNIPYYRRIISVRTKFTSW